MRIAGPCGSSTRDSRRAGSRRASRSRREKSETHVDRPGQTADCGGRRPGVGVTMMERFQRNNAEGNVVALAPDDGKSPDGRDGTQLARGKTYRASGYDQLGGRNDG